MSESTIGTTDRRAESNRQGQADSGPLPVDLPAAVRERTGTVALLAGGLVLIRALRTVRTSVARAAILGLVGGALLRFGRRRRQSGTGAGPGGEEFNPRGTANEPDVETKTDPESGDVQFTESDDEPRQKPDLEDGPDDPRRDVPDEDDESVEVDLSETAMADEASEATGPSTEQAYPSKEATDPEPDEAAEAAKTPTGESESAAVTEEAMTEGTDPSTDIEETDEEGEVDTGGGASVRDDTNQAGTMETDVEDVTDDEELTETMLENDAELREAPDEPAETDDEGEAEAGDGDTDADTDESES